VLKKLIVCVVTFVSVAFNINAQEALVLDINIGDELWIDGQIAFFNGWPPHIRILTSNNEIIGIDERNLPVIIIQNLFEKSISGRFKLKLISFHDVPYYVNRLMIFSILEYNAIGIGAKDGLGSVIFKD
jgi:hypothetical protein